MVEKFPAVLEILPQVLRGDFFLTDTVCVYVGLMYDVTGSYTVGFIILSCVALTALSIVIIIYIILKRTSKSVTLVDQSLSADTKC